MKTNQATAFIVSLTLLSSTLGLPSARALEPQTLFNFQLGPGDVGGALVEGSDGNFYGTTAKGGPKGNGTVFRVTRAGVLTILSSDQVNPAAGLVVGNDGLLYGMTGGGGAFGAGTAFKLTVDGVLTNFAVFNGVNASQPASGLVLARDGNFYGVSPQGGTHSVGSVFRVTPDGVVTALASFDDSEGGGSQPVAGLTLGPDGNLYGTTILGGDAGLGTIFKITTGGTLTTLYSFQATDGFSQEAQLALGPDGNLYGSTILGGDAGLGTIFKITTGGDFTTLVAFNRTNGAFPQAELTPGPDGQLYGTTQEGGEANFGTVFKVTTNGALTTLVSFDQTTGANSVPESGLLLASDGNFYGCGRGAVFKMTPDGVLTTLALLTSLSGVSPLSGLTPGPDGNFYGTTSTGGSNDAGTIFTVTPGGVLTSVFSFSGTNGSIPAGSLLLGKDGNFYGTTSQGGGRTQSGTLFRFSTNGTLTTLLSFDETTGGHPHCQLVMDAEGTLYGTTTEGGPDSFGTVFRVTTSGVLTTLVSFNGTNGAEPEDGLTPGNDGNFYGTTAGGGGHDAGTVFRVTPGGTLTTLFSFNPFNANTATTNGSIPLSGLVQASDGNLYGTTGFGGTSNSGTIFRITTEGVLTTLFNFHFTDGEKPSAKMIFGPDGSLYGTTSSGGSTNNNLAGLGTVFRITTNGVFTPLLLFQGSNGFNPQAPFVLGSDANLYGTAVEGGTGGGGTIFRIILTPRLTRIATLANGSIFLTGTGPSASPFQLWASTDLSLPVASWTLLTNGRFADDGTFSFTDTGTAAIPARFYRLSTP